MTRKSGPLGYGVLPGKTVRPAAPTVPVLITGEWFWTLDELDRGKPDPRHVFQGFQFDKADQWNGWAVPYFTKTEADRIMLAHGEPHMTRHVRMSYDPMRDLYITSHLELGEEDDEWWAQDFNGRVLYAVGAYSWIWEQVET